MRVLVVSQEFPSTGDPFLAPFNRQQFAALGRRCKVEVIAPLPWYPGARLLARWSEAGRRHPAPRWEEIEGLPVQHPHFLHLPLVGRPLAAALYAASLTRETLRRRGRYDVMLGSWAYPDGAACVALARLLGVPAVIKVHGTDVNVVARAPGVGPNLRWALPRAARVVAVSAPLADAVASFGVPRARIDVVPNGVDAAIFRPRDRAAARAEVGLGVMPRWLLYVGRLEASKGLLDLLEAFRMLARRRADVGLALVGDGTERDACETVRAELGERLVLAGSRPLDEVARWMAACDALVLPSWAEGTPNVILEALACGRRVISTRVGGTPDVVTGPELGELVPPRSPVLLAEALARAVDADYDPEEVARRGARGGWDESARKLEGCLIAALTAVPGRGA